MEKVIWCGVKERKQGEVGGYNHIQTHSLGLVKIYSSENAIFITIIKTQRSGHQHSPELSLPYTLFWNFIL